MSNITYRITLEDQSVHYATTTRKPPSFAASLCYEETPTRRVPGGMTLGGLGHLVEADPTKPMIAKQFVCFYEMRRHAKAACNNERWAAGHLDWRFARSDPRKRQVLKVIDAQPIAKRPASEQPRDYVSAAIADRHQSRSRSAS